MPGVTFFCVFVWLDTNRQGGGRTRVKVFYLQAYMFRELGDNCRKICTVYWISVCQLAILFCLVGPKAPICKLWTALREYCTSGPYFWRLCAFSQKNKANLDKVSYGSTQKYSKELKITVLTSVEATVVKLQQKMCENQYFPCFEP